MNDAEIKTKIREQVKKGKRISLQLPIGAGKPGGGFADMCSVPAHKCAACDANKPDFEFGSAGSKVCLHERCFHLWKEVERNPNII